MVVGYIRVSTDKQNTARQEVLMKELGVEKIYIEKISGKNANRPELNRMMDYVREGDCIIVESISRFARNTRDLLELVDQLEQKNVQFISKKEQLDTKSSAGRFILTIFGALATLEREAILERQREGIEIAKAQGKYKGRKKMELTLWDEVYCLWKEGKITATNACKQLNISRGTFYNRVNSERKK